jgi:hypothetical protein
VIKVARIPLMPRKVLKSKSLATHRNSNYKWKRNFRLSATSYLPEVFIKNMLMTQNSISVTTPTSERHAVA